MTFELRTYTAAPGKFDALLTRFRDHTVGIFARHGMESVGYWTRPDEPDTLIYLLRHHGDEAANWTAFRADEEWLALRAASETEGSYTSAIERVLLDPTAFSALQDATD
jgi:hypothetical protein